MHPSKMRQFKQCTLGLIWAMGIASVPSHAYVVQSLTIEEIGVASGGFGTSANFALGGEFNVDGASHGPFGFVSAGSTDGKIVMGRRQGPGAFTPGISVLGDPAHMEAFPNTLNYAPTGWVFESGGTLMVLQLQGFRVLLFSDANLVSADNVFAPLLQIDETHYYYTADWAHTISPFEDTFWAGHTFTWHLEGIATTPEPGTIWLVGGTLLGLLGTRYRKRSNAHR